MHSEPPNLLPASRLFMTGATGYLGGHLARMFAANQMQVFCLTRNPLAETTPQEGITWVSAGRENLIRFFQTQSIDCILHLATCYGRNQESRSNILEANLSLPVFLLDCAIQNGVPAFINTDTKLPRQTSLYALSKNQFLEWLKKDPVQTRVVNMALEHFYGPGEASSKFVSHIIKSLVKSVTSLDLTHGEQERDFIYIDDVKLAYQTIVNNLGQFPLGLTHFEVGSGIPVTIRNLVQMTQNLVENQSTLLNFGAIPYRADEVMHSQADIQGLSKFGWRPQISLTEGLSRTIQFTKRELFK